MVRFCYGLDTGAFAISGGVPVKVVCATDQRILLQSSFKAVRPVPNYWSSPAHCIGCLESAAVCLCSYTRLQTGSSNVAWFCNATTTSTTNLQPCVPQEGPRLHEEGWKPARGYKPSCYRRPHCSCRSRESVSHCVPRPPSLPFLHGSQKPIACR